MNTPKEHADKYANHRGAFHALIAKAVRDRDADHNAHDDLTAQRDALLCACENVAMNLEKQDFGPHHNWYRKNAISILRAAIGKAKP